MVFGIPPMSGQFRREAMVLDCSRAQTGLEVAELIAAKRGFRRVKGYER
jgi:hypothetical protein